VIWVAEAGGRSTCNDIKIHNLGSLTQLMLWVPDQAMNPILLLLLAGRCKVLSRATSSQISAYHFVVDQIRRWDIRYNRLSFSSAYASITFETAELDIRADDRLR
jgi:hypothetical protein